MNTLPNLILLHGALGSQPQFEPLAEILKSHFSIHTFDLPGHGGIPVPEKFSIPLFADALLHFIEVRHLSPVFVFGYSMGGYIALQVANDHPGLISKIMTLGTMLKWSPEIAEKEVRMMNPDILEAKIPKFAEQLKLRHAPQDWKVIMTKTAEMMLGLGNGEAMTLEDFEKIDIPVLISLGSLDQMAAKEDSIEVAKHLPNGRFHCFEGFKHPIEAVDAGVLAIAIQQFFMENCKNCGASVEGSYCSACGQKTKTERISFTYFGKELFYFFTHIKSGFFYTTWKMIFMPGQVVINYVEGKRKRYQSPIPYFLVWTSIFLLTLYLFVKVFGEKAVIDYNDYFGPGITTNHAISNLSIVLALIIPFQAFYVYSIITRKKYNYAESLVMAIYAVGTIIFLQFVFAILSLLTYFITAHPVDLHYSDIFKIAFLLWFTITLLHTFSVSHKWIRGILFFILAVGTFTVWRMYVVPWMVDYFFH